MSRMATFGSCVKLSLIKPWSFDVIRGHVFTEQSFKKAENFKAFPRGFGLETDKVGASKILKTLIGLFLPVLPNLVNYPLSSYTSESFLTVA